MIKTKKEIEKYTPVPNKFFNVIPQLDLPCVAKDILWALIRLTYGYHKDWRAFHICEIARIVGCPEKEAWRWFARLVRWGAIIRAKCFIKKTKRKYKPRYVYAVNPAIKKWAVFKRKRFYRESAESDTIPEGSIYLLGDKYERLFHQPPDEALYTELKELLQFYSPRRLIGIMKKSARRGDGWEGVVKRLSTEGIGGTDVE